MQKGLSLSDDRFLREAAVYSVVGARESKGALRGVIEKSDYSLQ